MLFKFNYYYDIGIFPTIVTGAQTLLICAANNIEREEVLDYFTNSRDCEDYVLMN